VTAYFNIPKSKANHETYKGWMENMLAIQNRMIIFCDASSVELIQSLRENNPCPAIIIQTKFEEFHCYKYIDIFRVQYEIDHEKDMHSVELYLIWNEKSNFLKRAIEIEKLFNEPHSNKFVWCDIGCFRMPNEWFLKWPDAAKIPDDKILLLEVMPLDPSNDPSDNPSVLPNLTFINHIGGTIFAGSSDAIMKWHDAYFAMLERLYAMGRFVGKDQTIMSSVYIDQPELCFCVKSHREYYDRWFYLQYYLL